MRLLVAGFVCLVMTAHGVAAEKVLVYGLDGQPEDSLDSAKAESERSNHPLWLLCEALLNVSKDGQGIEPGLAESWTASSDGLRVSFKLRPNVSFHDGTAVDARAVKASFERQFRPGHELYSSEPPNVREKLLRELIDEIRVVDSSTVSLKLKYPGLHYLSQIDVISPAAARRLGRDFGRQPVCSGPFKLESRSDDRIVLIANDRYWGGRPKIDRVVFRAFDEPKVIVERLLSGDVDYTPTLRDTAYFERVMQSPQVTLLPVAALNVYYLGFYTERRPFNDARLRRAVVHAIDAPRIAIFLGRGAAIPARGPLPPGMKAYDSTARQAPYDQGRARALLAEGGYTAGPRLRLLHHNGIAIDAEVASAIRSDLGRVGIAVDLLGKPTWTDAAAALKARDGDMFLYSWHVRAPYPERILVPLFHSRAPGATNLTHYQNPEVDKLLDEALRLPEGPDQRRGYSHAQKLIVEDAPMAFLYHATRMAVVGHRVQGLELNLGALPYDKLLKVDLRP